MGTSELEVGLEPALDPNFRTLRDVVSSVEDGLPLAPPPSNLTKRPDHEPTTVHYKNVLLENSLLPVDGWNISVGTLSVFSKTGWVERKLTPKELAIAFDLPVDLHRSWEFALGELPFLRTTPSKVLMSLELAVVGSVASHAVARPVPVRSETPLSLPSSLPAALLTQSGVAVKAAKANDAEADVSLWDAELAELFPEQLKVLSKEKLGWVCKAWRNGLIEDWKRRMTKEASEYLYSRHGASWRTTRSRDNPALGKDRIVIGDALRRVYHCTYWEWQQGSALFFWRWTTEFVSRARDGVKVFQQAKFPRYRRHQPNPKDEEKAEQVRKKLGKVRERGYIEPSPVNSLTGYFDVEKAGGSDIRMVYDATKCGLNDAIWP